MNSEIHFHIVAIPLNRERIISFLDSPSNTPMGTNVRIMAQRPTVASEIEWCERLRDEPTIDKLMWRDQPKNHLMETTTDRLIPVEYLRNDDGYLTRNLGGWSPVYFGLIEAETPDFSNDPLLSEAAILADYGNDIRSFGADINLVNQRLQAEFGTDSIKAIANGIVWLHDWRSKHFFNRSAIDMMDYAGKLYSRLMNEENSFEDGLSSYWVPRPALIDELTGQMVRIESARRAFVANGHIDPAKEIAEWQQTVGQEHGLNLILKGEYVMGRQRRSTILIAEELGIVVKQPGVEPFHEADMGAKTYNGKPENWPVLTETGAVVTAAGRVRLSIEEGIIEKLSQVFSHKITCMSAFGYIIEPFVQGPTLQEYLLDNRSRLTPTLYESILLHQLICEELGVENGDWHAANFIIIEDKENAFIQGLPKMVHIDWGAARPLENDELSVSDKEARTHQVMNIGFSFQDEILAREVEHIHKTITDNPQRLSELRKQASKIANSH